MQTRIPAFSTKTVQWKYYPDETALSPTPGGSSLSLQFQLVFRSLAQFSEKKVPFLFLFHQTDSNNQDHQKFKTHSI